MGVGDPIVQDVVIESIGIEIGVGNDWTFQFTFSPAPDNSDLFVLGTSELGSAAVLG